MNKNQAMGVLIVSVVAIFTAFVVADSVLTFENYDGIKENDTHKCTANFTVPRYGVEHRIDEDNKVCWQKNRSNTYTNETGLNESRTG